MGTIRSMKIHGMVKVGTKGQIVIPKSARDLGSIDVGDELIVISKTGEGLMLFKVDTFEDMKMLVNSIDEEMQKNKKTHKKS